MYLRVRPVPSKVHITIAIPWLCSHRIDSAIIVSIQASIHRTSNFGDGARIPKPRLAMYASPAVSTTTRLGILQPFAQQHWPGHSPAGKPTRYVPRALGGVTVGSHRVTELSAVFTSHIKAGWSSSWWTTSPPANPSYRVPLDCRASKATPPSPMVRDKRAVFTAVYATVNFAVKPQKT